MCLLGKRYPPSLTAFLRAGFDDDMAFDPSRAGRRMRLAVAPTWETRVSKHGNKASTWQILLERKQLPFMAMLRNIRNLIGAGVSDAHHKMVLDRLRSAEQVGNSRQFPYVVGRRSLLLKRRRFAPTGGRQAARRFCTTALRALLCGGLVWRWAQVPLLLRLPRPRGVRGKASAPAGRGDNQRSF